MSGLKLAFAAVFTEVSGVMLGLVSAVRGFTPGVVIGAAAFLFGGMMFSACIARSGEDAGDKKMKELKKWSR